LKTMILVVLGAPIALAAAGLIVLAVRPPAMNPPSDLKVELTPERVARGEYLVKHVFECVGCHSDHLYERWGMPVKPGTLLQGGFRFTKEQAVPGEVTAQNLTADVETGLGSWTDGEIVRAIREGINRDGRAMFPMMPYPDYLGMSDDDVHAVVAYLRIPRADLESDSTDDDRVSSEPLHQAAT